MCQPSIDALLKALEDLFKSFDYKFDGVYYPLNGNIDKLTSRLDALKQEVDTIQRQLDFQAEKPTSIRYNRPPIDDHPTKAYTRVEIDEIIERLYRDLNTSEDASYKRFDEIYFPLDNNISWLTLRTDKMKKDITAIQTQLVSRPEAPTSIDRGYSILIDKCKPSAVDIPKSTSIDDESTSDREKLVTEKLSEEKLDAITSIQEVINKEQKDILAYTYDKLGKH